MSNIIFILIPILLSLCLLATSCTVGPDFVKPEYDINDSFADTPDIEDKSRVVDSNENTCECSELSCPKEKWWKQFNDPCLNELIAYAICNNLDVQIAITQVKQARAQRCGVVADQLPDVNAQFNYSRNRASDNYFRNISDSGNTLRSATSPRTTNNFNPLFDATWEVNLFGAYRAIEAAYYQVCSAIFNQEYVVISLIGEIALNYIELRNNQSKLNIYEIAVKDWDEIVTLNKDLLKAGKEDTINLSQIQASAEYAKSEIPILKTKIAANRHQIEVLVGKFPDTLYDELSEPKPIPTTPHFDLDQTPLEVIDQRPDVQVARENLAAQTATLGYSISLCYPSFPLSALVGYQSTAAHNLFAPASNVASGAFSAIMPIIDFGRIRSQINLSEAQRKQMCFTYEKVIAIALQDVKDSLVGYLNNEKTNVSLTNRVQDDQLAVELSKSRYHAGLISYLDLLNLQETLYSAQLDNSDSQANLAISYISLQKSLGEDWREECEECCEYDECDDCVE